MADANEIGALIVEALTRWHDATDADGDMETFLFGHLTCSELAACAAGLTATVYGTLLQEADDTNSDVMDIIRELGLLFAEGACSDG